MKKKQTAVNQIFAQIKAARKDTKFWNDSMLVDWLLEQEKRFKQMEKEQIEMACNQQEFEDIDGLGICETISKGQQYYNETYGDQDEN